MVENNVEKIEVEVKKVDESETRTGSVSSESTGRTTTQDIDHLLKGKTYFICHINCILLSNKLFLDLEKNIHEAKRASEGKKKDGRDSEENPLDAMLDDMINTDNLGVTPTSKGTCPTCNRPVMGEAVAALGKVWHRGECFMFQPTEHQFQSTLCARLMTKKLEATLISHGMIKFIVKVIITSYSLRSVQNAESRFWRI